MKKNSKQIIFALISAVVMIALDQWTKYLAVAHLKDSDPKVLIDGVLEFRFIINRGAAFSILQDQQIFFYILTVLVLGGLSWLFLFRIPGDSHFRPLNMICIMLMSGAIGNFFDRARMRYVIDFIYFKLIDFPTFNVADCYITVSCVVFILLLLFYYKEEELKDIL